MDGSEGRTSRRGRAASACAAHGHQSEEAAVASISSRRELEHASDPPDTGDGSQGRQGVEANLGGAVSVRTRTTQHCTQTGPKKDENSLSVPARASFGFRLGIRGGPSTLRGSPRTRERHVRVLAGPWSPLLRRASGESAHDADRQLAGAWRGGGYPTSSSWRRADQPGRGLCAVERPRGYDVDQHSADIFVA